MSDIHGQDQLYFEMLKQIEFHTFQKRDHLYILGDVIDRGPGSMKILQHIYEHGEHITLLMGNHEKMMVEAYIENDPDLWFHNGGRVTYYEFMKLEPVRQKELFEYLERLPYYKTITVNRQDYYLVHGSPFPHANKVNDYKRKEVILEMSSREQMLWQDMQLAFCKENHIVVFGHRVTSESRKKGNDLYSLFRQTVEPCTIYKEDKMIGIDCGCAGFPGGRLGCLRLQDGKEYYSELVKRRG